MSHILLVDDDPDVLHLLSMAFEGAGHQVLATEDPEEVVASGMAQGFDAVVLDVTMPRRSGWEVLEELRRNPRTEHLPVVMLSTIGDAANRAKGIRMGADDFLAKPFHPDEILARVERLLERQASEPRGLQGDFSSFAASELLQALHHSAASGTLEVFTPQGAGWLRFAAGRCVSAEFAGLHGAEAVLSLPGQSAGSFRLRREWVVDEMPRPELPPLSNLLLESVWIEDELRMREPFLPPEDRSLYRMEGAAVACPIDGMPHLPATEILAFLRARPGASLSALLAARLAAPDRVRLAVAWLNESGQIRVGRT
jgi:DNA-binding response OmpR family regulator